MERLSAWRGYRTLAGAAGAGWVDNLDIDDVSLNPYAAVNPFPVFDAGRFETALVYWTATAENRAAHTLTIEPLIWDGSNNRWATQPTFVLHPREVGTFPVSNASVVGLRIHAQNAPGASDANIFYTGGQPAVNG